MSTGSMPPVGGKRAFQDLAGGAHLREVIERFAAATRCAVGLASYPTREILVTTEEPIVCTRFPSHPHPARRGSPPSTGCIARHLNSRKKAGAVACAHGLAGETAPIVIEKERLATLYVGGVLIEPPARARAREWALANGHDPADYWEAIKRVPVIDHGRLPQILLSLVKTLEMAASLGLENRRLRDDAETYYAIFDGAFQLTERKLAEEKLARSQAALAEAQRIAHFGYWEWNVRTGEVEWSDEVYRIFGLDPEHFTPQIDSILALSPPEEQDRGRELMERTIENRQPGSYEQHFRRPDGTTGMYQSTYEGLFDEEGNLVRMVGVVLDVTERKRAEEALRQTIKKHERLVNNMRGTFLYRHDREGILTYLSDSITQVMGYRRDEALRSFTEFLTGHPCNTVGQEHTAKTLQGIWQSGYELQVFDKSGQVRWLDVSEVPVRDDKGNVVAVEGIAHDVTERKRAEEALRNTIETHERLVNNLTDTFLYRHDTAGVFTYVSQSVTEVLGYAPAELLTHFDEYHTGHPCNRVAEERTAKSMKGIRQPPYEVQVYGKNGEMHWLDVSEVPVWDEQGNVIAVEGIAHDITERKRAEDAVRASEDALRTVFDNTHDALFLHTVDGRVVDVNRKMLELYGVTKDQALSLSIADDFTAPDWPTDSLPGRWRSVVNGEPQVFDWKARRPNDGSTFYVEVALQRIRIRDEFMILANVHDVTERKRAEEALRESEQQFRTLVEHAPEAIVMLDPATWRFAIVNRNAERLYKLEREQLLQVGPADMSPPTQPDGRPSPEAAREHIQRALDGGRPVFEWVHLNSDGEEVTCEIRAVRLPGERRLVCGIVIDIGERKRAEVALQESEQRFRTLVEHAPEAIVILDAETGRFVMANKNAEDLYGLSRDQLLQVGPAEMSPPLQPDGRPSREAAMEYIQEALDGGTPSAEWMHINSRGEEIMCEVRVVRLPGEGALVRGSVIDIRKRKSAEEALRKSKESLQQVLELLPGMAFVKSREGRFLYVNKQVADSLDMTVEDLIGRLHAEVHPDKEEVERMLAADRTVLETGEMLTIPFQPYHTARGELKWVSVRKIPFTPLDSDEKAVLGISIDVTSLKEAEEELHRLRNYLGNIIDSMPSVLVGIDTAGRVTQWNRRAEQETGIEAGAAAGRLLEEVFPRLASEMPMIETAIRERRAKRDPKRPHSTESGMRYEDVTIYPLAANGVEGVVLRVDDVTERVRLEEMMIQSEKMLSVGGLAAGMAHEINNPLAGMMQNASVLINRLTEDIPANDKAASECGTDMAAIRAFMEKRGVLKQLAMIHESGARAAEIVRNMLSFARKSDSAALPADLCDLLDKTVALAESDYDLRRRFDFRQIEIVREYEPDMPPAPCEPTKIQQVFLNLLKNGAEAMGEERRQTEGADTKGRQRFILRVARDGDMARVEIEDNGPGMDEETCRRALEPFFTTKQVGEGTGLGLSVSYFIVTENHGGTMSVESRPGKGTKFTVCLPLAGKSGS